MINKALELAAQGFFVFPLRPKSKEAAILNWPNVASQDPEWIHGMWKAASAKHAGPGKELNIGILMGKKTGVIGLDIDFDNGAAPEFLQRLPPTWVAKSATGYHAFFKYPEHWPAFGTVPLMRGPKGEELVTIRGDRHYFAAVGSIHPDTGKPYEWLKNDGQWENLDCDLLAPGETNIAEAPEWFLGVLGTASSTMKEAMRAEDAPNGKPSKEKYFENERHSMLLKTAVAMRKEGREFAEILKRLTFRNEKDCDPPKENAARELENLARWAENCVLPAPKDNPTSDKGLSQGETRKAQKAPPQDLSLVDQHIKCLGVQDKDYFYITSENKQLIRLSSHTNGTLLNLMPLEFWQETFPAKGRPNWDAAASFLIHKCLDVGPFNPKRIRGTGAWNDNNRLVLHLGNRIFTDDNNSISLTEFPSQNFYKLGFEFAPPLARDASATLEECRTLIDACRAPNWKAASSEILFAGQLALLRISGALPWRPHGWVTGPAGCGKSTIIDHLVSTMAGEWKILPQGDTSGPGIRQALECDSLAVIFDESEAEDRKAGGRMKGVIELARQSSSDGEGRIYKGTPDGRGQEYKINSMFLLGSIGVTLSQEADLTRFTIYELNRPPEGADKFEFERRLETVTKEIADKIWSRMVHRYSDLLTNYKLLHKKIAAKSTARHGDQYGILLAGYSLLIKDSILTNEEAEALASQIDLAERTSEMNESSAEQTCLQRLLDSKFRFQAREFDPLQDLTLQFILSLCKGDVLAQDKLEQFGLSLREDGLAIANQHPALEPVFFNTAWEKNWKRSLLRIPGAIPTRQRYCNGNPKQAVLIPPRAIKPSISDAPHDDGIR